MGGLCTDDFWITNSDGKARGLVNRFFPTSLLPNTQTHDAVRSQVSAFFATMENADIPIVPRKELHDAIWASGARKALGADEVPSVCLCECEDILSPYLLLLFSASWRL